jgi:ribonuclease Z
MTELTVLGTAASVPDAEHDTIGLLLRGSEWSVLIDCGGSPLWKLARLGIDLAEIKAVVLTHRHADHVYGLPMLVQGLWLSGRLSPLPIYGPPETLDVARNLLELFTLDERSDMYDLEWRPVPPREGRRVLEIDSVRITASPGVHLQVQTLALRFDNTSTGRSIVYSADTEPCAAVARLAEGADILLHEASGEQRGHSSPSQAAEVALEAGVGSLVLIHYPVRGIDLESWRLEACRFAGPVSLAKDGDIYRL